jgi:hypothetical protein
MKIVVSVVIAFGLGLASMYLYIGKGFSAMNQISSEIQISNHIKYLELIEQGKIEPLKNLFRMNIDCMSATYENNLDSFFWEKSQSSKAVLEKTKPYIINGSSCDEIRNSGV